MLYFPIDFNNFHLSPISSILHRSARCMKHMFSRTCRFGVVKNATCSYCILTISLFVFMRSSKWLLPPSVLDTFSFWLKFVTIGALRCNQQISCVVNFIAYFHCICIVFMLTLLGVVFVKLTKWQRALRNMLASKTLMFTKRRCA